MSFINIVSFYLITICNILCSAIAQDCNNTNKYDISLFKLECLD